MPISKITEASTDSGLYYAKAWVNFNGTGTVAIHTSGNVSSITDNGIADYTVNFLTAFPDVYYAYAFGFNNVNDTTGTNASLANSPSNYRLTTSFRFMAFNIYNGGANYSQDNSRLALCFFR